MGGGGEDLSRQAETECMDSAFRVLYTELQMIKTEKQKDFIKT